ncbi:MAG: hypothetical protein HY291_04535 [Planctomycetes bacterium]|nr:hypothetical protein [Planctomycetota bacterium]
METRMSDTPAAPAPAPSGATPPPAAGTAPASAAPAPVGVALIGIDDFAKVKLATAEVVAAEPHPKADRLLILNLKVGEKTKRIVSGIREFYSPEQMVGRTVIVVDNLQPAKLRGEVSEGMLLAVRLPEGGLRLLTTDGPAPSGLSVS